MSLEDVERFLIQKALSRYDGNVSHAARGARPEPQRALPPPAALRASDATSEDARGARSARHRPRCALGAPSLPGASSSRSSLLWTGDHTPRTQWTLTVTLRRPRRLGFLGLAAGPRDHAAADRRQPAGGAARGRLLDPRARLAARRSALRPARRGQRARRDAARAAARALEATALLRKVMAEIDVAIFAFDERAAAAARQPRRRAAARARRPSACSIATPPSSSWISGSPRSAPRIEALDLSRRDRPLGGAPHAVPPARPAASPVVLDRRQQPLRDEERAAWQRLIRVLGHELNNSLAPIKSIAGSLGSLVQREPRPADWATDLRARPRASSRRAPRRSAAS